MAKPVALITGASSGIGHAFAEVFAERGYNLIVTGRRESRLEELADRVDAQVTPIAIDLSTGRGPQRLFEAVEETSLNVDVLVNNAGTSLAGPFTELPHTKLVDIVNLNVRALTELTSLFVRPMVERGKGRILNVASVVGFNAVPGMSVYSASKAYVLSFTESLSEELRDTGVTVTALCPGLTRTEMVGDLNADQIPEFFMADPKAVAREGYDACMLGEAIRVPGYMNQAMVSWMEMQPRWLVRMMSGFAARAASFTQTGR